MTTSFAQSWQQPPVVEQKHPQPNRPVLFRLICFSSIVDTKITETVGPLTPLLSIWFCEKVKRVVAGSLSDLHLMEGSSLWRIKIDPSPRVAPLTWAVGGKRNKSEATFFPSQSNCCIQASDNKTQPHQQRNKGAFLLYSLRVGVGWGDLDEHRFTPSQEGN